MKMKLLAGVICVVIALLIGCETVEVAERERARVFHTEKASKFVAPNEYKENFQGQDHMLFCGFSNIEYMDEIFDNPTDCILDYHEEIAEYAFKYDDETDSIVRYYFGKTEHGQKYSSAKLSIYSNDYHLNVAFYITNKFLEFPASIANITTYLAENGVNAVVVEQPLFIRGKYYDDEPVYTEFLPGDYELPKNPPYFLWVNTDQGAYFIAFAENGKINYDNMMSNYHLYTAKEFCEKFQVKL